MVKLFFIVLLFVMCESVAMAAGTVVLASWYGRSPALEGAPMANGKPFRSRDTSIVAHKTLPIHTRLVVINPDNGRRLNMEVQDRGPFVKGRELDLSWAAAEYLGYTKKGVARLVMVVNNKY